MPITKISAVLLVIGLVVGIGAGYGAGFAIYESQVSKIQSDLSTEQSRVTSLENLFQELSISIDDVKVGQEFNITLESNPTTGYQWQLAKQLNGTVLVFLGSEYKPSESDLLGAGGIEIWRFKAVNSGTTEISLKYVRPWETDVPPIKEQTFGIIVNL
jgi:predicted secreted protein